MPMKLSFIFSVAEKVPEHLRRTLVYEPFSPQKAAMVEDETSIMKQIRRKDILLSYPYESMEPFLKLLKEAGSDPSVVTIKITITSGEESQTRRISVCRCRKRERSHRAD